MPVTTPVDINFGTDGMRDFNEFIYNNLISLKSSLSELHEQKVPEWRRLYRGIPDEETRNFPWPNASNVVIQLIGENVDILKAGIIGSIYEIYPLWVMKTVGLWSPDENADEQKAAAQDFMNLMGLEPTELDMYRVESLAANDMIQFGTVVIKQPWETDVEKLVVGPSTNDRGEPATVEFTKYDGPRPEKLAFEDWGASPEAATIEKARFKYHKYSLFKDQLENKFASGLFKLSKEEQDKMLASPDRIGDDTIETQKKQDNNIQSANPTNDMAKWDIHECWFPYFHNNQKYRILCSYHLPTKKILRAVFNFYPDNEEPFELGRLGFTDDGLYGYGFAEMLKYYQEEVSTGHNQRVDNRTLANTSVLFAGRNGKLDAGFSIYPMAVLPFDPNEVELKQLGANYPSSVQEEELTIALAKARSGVENGMQGSGAGTTNPKKGGNFSAMGTFAVMQAGNRRININTTDFRYMHLKLGRKAFKQYAHFGIGKRQNVWGEQAKYLIKALENVKKGRLELPIRAATASVNTEVEKQNGMLFTQVMQRHYMSISQVFQGIQNPAMPQEMREFLLGSIKGMSAVMSKLLRAFGYDDLLTLQPEMEIMRKMKEGAINGHQNISQTQVTNGQTNQNIPALP